MKRQSGITMVEQLITLMVVSVAVLGVTKYQVNMYSAELNSKQRAEAVSLAQQQLEILKSSGYDAAAVTGFNSIQGNTARFDLSWNVTPDVTLPYDRANVSVAWATKGQNNSASLASRIASAPQTAAGQFMLGLEGANGSTGASIYTPGSSTAGGAGTSTGTGGTATSLGTLTPPPATSDVSTQNLPANCICSKSRQGQSYSYSVTSGQDARCTISLCSAAPNQCAPANNAACSFTISVSQ